MRAFQLFPTTVVQDAPTDAVFVIGTDRYATHADEAVSICEYNGVALGRPVGRITCANGVLVWNPRQQASVTIEANCPLLRKETKDQQDDVIVGNAIKLRTGRFAFQLDPAYGLQLDREELEIMCPKCALFQAYEPPRDRVTCSFCRHIIDRDWGVYVRHYRETPSSHRRTLMQGRLGTPASMKNLEA